MLYFDQLSTIAKHLNSRKTLQASTILIHSVKIDNSSPEQHRYLVKTIKSVRKNGVICSAKAIIPQNKQSSNKLTHWKLKNMDTWQEWKHSEHK